jgi:hypothetical protein
VYTQAVERHVVNSVRIDTVWWPAEFLEQPFGTGTKIYQEEEVIEMLYDLEATAKYSQPYDSFNIISGKPSEGLMVDSEILNALIPNGLRGEIF